MSATQIALRKAAILIHRWMGVPFAVLFLIWFLSGIVLMYSDYPKVEPAKRLQSAAPLNPAQVKLTPGDAFARTGKATPPTRVTLNMLEDRPVYRFAQGRAQIVVYADSGEVVRQIPRATGLAVAARFTGQPAAQAEFLGALNDEDQWTLNKNVRPLRPFYKYAWPNGEEVYVSQVSGEVMQHTTSETRLLAWLGAIPHWIYFTEIRKDTSSWRALVIWLSAIGTIMTVFGLVVGLWLFSPEKRYRFPSGPSSVPYSGQKRWHTILGLVFGLCTFTWILSGMFSMNPNQWSPEFDDTAAANELMQGGKWRFEPFAAANLADVVARASAQLSVKELEFRLLGGEIAFVARQGPQQSVFLRSSGAPQAEIDAASIQMPGIVSRARLLEYDAYYIDRRGRKPLPAERVDLADGSTHYIDLKTGQVVNSYVTLSRWNRWLYHGLHSLDLPWLYKYRPLWDILVLALMLGGVALSVTSVVIAWRRAVRKVAEIKRARHKASPTSKVVEA